MTLACLDVSCATRVGVYCGCGTWAGMRSIN